MGMRRETGLRLDDVIIPDTKAAPAHAIRVMVIGKREMVMGIQPAMIGPAKAGEGADFYLCFAVDYRNAPDFCVAAKIGL